MFSTNAPISQYTRSSEAISKSMLKKSTLWDLREVLQKPYMRSLAREDGKSRITYFPSRFTVGTVLSGDLSEVHAVEEEELPWLGGYTRPDKMALRVEFCDPAYGGMAHTRQRQTPSTRGKFATVVAEEIQKIIAGLPAFPYTLDQIKVLSIDVHFRGTMQPRIFVTSDATAA